ncbi:MAG: peptide chain release factor N(5)-glutamine methyltransferase [Chloroflexota bacterium]
MTIQDALAWARHQLQGSPTAAGDARLLLQYVLGVEHSYLAAHPERLLEKDEETALRALVSRAAKQEPIPYIIGEAPFYGLSFKVTPDVLIPRPETELLVEQAIAWAEESEARRIVDVGTGSGCIAVTLARRLPRATILAIDVSAAALMVARENARRHRVAGRSGEKGRVTFLQGSLLAPVSRWPHLIVANLPYITDEEWTAIDDGVKWYEPAGALRGGPDGLDSIRHLLYQARTRLEPGGAIFLEIGWRQGPAARDLAQSVFPAARVTVIPDYGGHDRIITIRT